MLTLWISNKTSIEMDMALKVHNSQIPQYSSQLLWKDSSTDHLTMFPFNLLEQVRFSQNFDGIFLC